MRLSAKLAATVAVARPVATAADVAAGAGEAMQSLVQVQYPAAWACGDRDAGGTLGGGDTNWTHLRLLLLASAEESGGVACTPAGERSDDAVDEATAVMKARHQDFLTYLRLGRDPTQRGDLFGYCSGDGEFPYPFQDQYGPVGPPPAFCVFGIVSVAACLLRVHLIVAETDDTQDQEQHKTQAVEYADFTRRWIRTPGGFMHYFGSSGWPFTLPEIMGLIDQAHDLEVPPVRWAVDAARLRRQTTRAAATAGLELASPSAKKKIRIGAFSMHSSLMREPMSIWDLLSEPSDAEFGLQVQVTTYFSLFYCHQSDREDKPAYEDYSPECTKDVRLQELVDGILLKGSPSRWYKSLRFPEITDFHELKRRFRQAFGSEVGSYDILACGEPPAFCALFPPGIAVLAVIGVPLGAYLRPRGFCDEDSSRCYQQLFYSEFHSLVAADERNVVVATSMYLANQVYWNCGVLPRYVRPVGIYTGVKYSPSASVLDGGVVLLSRAPYLIWDTVCIFQRVAALLPGIGDVPRFASMNALADRSYRSWASHVACVFWPYDPQLLTFHELYGMNMPLFVPSPDSLPFYISPGFDTLDDFAYQRDGWRPPEDELPFTWADSDSFKRFQTPYVALRFWAELTDFVAGDEGFPGLFAFDTLLGLLHTLLTADLRAASNDMLLQNRRDLARSLFFWNAALRKAMGPASA